MYGDSSAGMMIISSFIETRKVAQKCFVGTDTVMIR
jgi:hypothetical protein